MTKIFIVVLVILAVLVGWIYFWQNKTISETNSQISDQSPPKSNYININWKFSLDIPEGYLVRDEEDIFYVVKKPAADDETPSPEMTIKIEKGSKTTIDASEEMKVISQESVLINGVDGHKTIVAYDSYPEGTECPIYRLHKNGLVYGFSLYECLESDIFESVVQTFKII